MDDYNQNNTYEGPCIHCHGPLLYSIEVLKSSPSTWGSVNANLVNTHPYYAQAIIDCPKCGRRADKNRSTTSYASVGELLERLGLNPIMTPEEGQ